MLGLLAVFAAVLAVASPAGAASSCGRAVIDDWYDNGRVDGTYALHCYDDAIDTLPRDVRGLLERQGRHPARAPGAQAGRRTACLDRSDARRRNSDDAGGSRRSERIPV